MSKREKDTLADIANMEIEPLSDELLDSVAGGESNANGCSCIACSYTCGGQEEIEHQ